ncbi:MAG: cytochrome C biogenesis protein [Rhizobium sp.]|nr:cytochrome C biogenesis protein [Rhizobium sp.]
MNIVSAKICRLRIALTVLAVALSGALPGAIGTSRAETSAWAVNEGGRMRLVVLPADEQGKRAGALQIEPSPGWITYWREPGDAGIPPSITLAPDSGYTLTEVAYPVPKRIDSGDLRDIGYDGPVTLPLVLSGPADGRLSSGELKASVFIGLCRNICIPFQAEFQLALTLSETTDTEETELVAAARRTLPEPPSADFAVRSHALSADGKALSLTVTVPEATRQDEAEIFVTGPSGHVFFKERERRLEGNGLSVVLPISGLPRKYDIHGKRWGVLVKAGGRAMETTLAFDKRQSIFRD